MKVEYTVNFDLAAFGLYITDVQTEHGTRTVLADVSSKDEDEEEGGPFEADIAKLKKQEPFRTARDYELKYDWRAQGVYVERSMRFVPRAVDEDSEDPQIRIDDPFASDQYILSLSGISVTFFGSGGEPLEQGLYRFDETVEDDEGNKTTVSCVGLLHIVESRWGHNMMYSLDIETAPSLRVIERFVWDLLTEELGCVDHTPFNA